MKNVLIETVKEAYKREIEYKQTKNRYENRTNDLNLLLDFKALKLTNQKQRDAYIESKLKNTKKLLIKQEVEYHNAIRTFEAYKILVQLEKTEE